MENKFSQTDSLFPETSGCSGREILAQLKGTILSPANKTPAIEEESTPQQRILSQLLGMCEKGEITANVELIKSNNPSQPDINVYYPLGKTLLGIFVEDSEVKLVSTDVNQAPVEKIFAAPDPSQAQEGVSSLKLGLNSNGEIAEVAELKTIIWRLHHSTSCDVA